LVQKNGSSHKNKDNPRRQREKRKKVIIVMPMLILLRRKYRGRGCAQGTKRVGVERDRFCTIAWRL
jgi:hypothetical protein